MISSGSGGARAAIVFDASDKTGAAFDSLQKRLAGAQVQLKGVAESASALPARFGTIGVALAAAFAGASLKGAIDVGDQLDDLSEKTGIAVKDLSALRYAGEVTGTPLESLATGVKKLSTAMYDAAGGGKEQAAVFKALGVEIRTADGALRSSDAVLGDIADRFAGFADGPEKAALAVKVFGKAGADMIPLLNQGSAGIRDLREEADKLGVTIGEETARSFAAFNDNLTKLQLYADSSKTTIAGQLVPTLNTLAEAFIETRDGGNSFAELVGGTLKTGMEAISVLAANVVFVFKGVGREIGAIAAQMAALARFDLAGFSAISEAVKEDGVRARAELDALEQRILNTGKSLAGAGRGTARDPRELGSVGTIREQAQALKIRAPIVDTTDAGAKESAYDALNKRIQERIDLSIEELAAGRELTDMEKMRAKVEADMAAAKDKLTAAQRAAIRAALDEAEGWQQVLDQQRNELALAKQIAAERQRLRNADNDSVGAYLKDQAAQFEANLQSIRERTESIDAEIAAMELATQQNISLAEAVELVTIARLRERQARTLEWNGVDERGNPIRGQEWERLDREIQAREKLLANMGNSRAFTEMRDSWSRLVEDIYSGLTDSLYRAFESGGKFFSTFWAGIKNTIKSTVLRIAIQAVLGTSGGGGVIGQMLQVGSGVAGAGGGLGGVGSVLGLAGSLGTFSGGLAAGFGGLTGSIGSLFGIAGTGTTLGGSISAGMTALGAGNIAGGLGTLAGALGPIAAGIALVASLAKSFKGETRAGGQYNFGTLVSGPSGGEIGGSGVAAKMAQTTADAINETLARVGSSARLSNFFSGLESSSNGKGFVGAGGTLTTGQAFGEGWGAAFARDLWQNRRGNFTSEEALAAYQDELMQATLQALQAATDVPKTIQQELAGKDFNGMVKSELEATLGTINTIITDVGRFQAAAQQLPFERLAGLSFDLAAALGKAAGGMDTLLAGMQAFYSADFFSESELRQQTARNIQRTLAAAGATFSVEDILSAADKGAVGRAMWRQVVTEFEQQVAQGNEAAAPLLAALYSVSGAFAGITPIIEEVAETVGDSLDQIAKDQADYRNALASAGGGIASLIRDLTVNRAGLASPGDKLSAARGLYLQDLAGARGGDIAASQRVADSARAYIDAQVGYTASGPQSNATISQVLAELAALPAFKSYEQQLVEQGAEQAQLLKDIKLNTGATVSAVTGGFQGLAGYVPGTVATPSAPSGGAAFGGTQTIAQAIPAAVSVGGTVAGSGGASFGGSATVVGSSGTFAQALAGIDWADGPSGRAAMVAAMQQFGATIADVAGVYSWFTPQQLADDLKANGYAWAVPGYAQGANRIPETQLAVLHPNEAVLPAAFNPWAGGVLPMDDGGTRDELRGLRSDVQGLRSELDRLSQAVERKTVVDAAVARESLAQGAQIVDNTAASKTAALLEANKPTPVRSGAA